MLLYVEGLLAPSVVFSQSLGLHSPPLLFLAWLLGLILTSPLLLLLAPMRLSPPSFTVTSLHIALTAFRPYVAEHRLHYYASHNAVTTDGVLGLDWSSMIRKNLLLNGYWLDHTFDPWVHFTEAQVVSLRQPPLGIYTQAAVVTTPDMFDVVMAYVRLTQPNSGCIDKVRTGGANDLLASVPTDILVEILKHFTLTAYRKMESGKDIEKICGAGSFIASPMKARSSRPEVGRAPSPVAEFQKKTVFISTRNAMQKQWPQNK
ncbi:hypothetical protein C8F04DRAFT_1252134 [Mycena alexandri]|uniref:Uncharacterized protein n=1 Tax=Mycena alexandri TaxID=1745969 RepID=A0AAD6T9S6_9AGAR|nr:hypothetical protein C8F04DRAFT_1252134 [Mycena alexandri]